MTAVTTVFADLSSVGVIRIPRPPARCSYPWFDPKDAFQFDWSQEWVQMAGMPVKAISLFGFKQPLQPAPTIFFKF